uniref:Uncharacterized protein n=1 Tax=Paramormyrops kingsleyae TaxID=1676925 RepID=A0A3B3T0W4_9TELE
ISDSMEQDQFFSLLSHVQRGNMDDQRCVLDPNKKILNIFSSSFHILDSDLEQLLNLVATTQRCRLDDQRVSIKKLPGLHEAAGTDQDGQKKTAAGQKPNQPVSTVRISVDP